MLERLADPGFRSFFTALRNRIPPPHAFAGRRAIGIEKAARAFFAARDAHDEQIAHGQRWRRGTVRVGMRSHFRIPQLLSGEPVEGQKMRVVGHHERPVAADRDAAIGADAAFAEDAFGTGLAVGPDLAAGRRVEREDFVRARHVHDAVLHDGRRLHRSRIAGNLKNPGGAQPLHVGCVDELQRAVAIAASDCRRSASNPLWVRSALPVDVAVFRERHVLAVSSSTADTSDCANSMPVRERPSPS